MSKLSLLLLTLASPVLLGAFSGCAIRNDLETPYSPPADQPAVEVGSPKGEATRGTRFCAPAPDGSFDAESIVVHSGLNSSDGSAWAEGGGCVLRPIRETWASIHNLEVTKPDEVDRFTYVRTIDPRPGFTHLYEITYFMGTIIGPIDWTIDWYHGVDKGTFEDPQEVTIDYSRTRGTSNIPIWRGGIVLTKVNDSVTSIAVRNEFKARQSSSDNRQSASDTMVGTVQDARHAAPDWERLNLGFKDNPSEPDKPVTAHVPTRPPSAFCTKNADGKYPAQPAVSSSTENGISSLTLRACLPFELAAVAAKLRNPAELRWANASVARLSGPATPGADESTVFYEKSRFLRSPLHWGMLWRFAEAPASATAPAQFTATYQIDPETGDFPVWNGTVTLAQLEPAETFIQIENSILTDEVSKSPKVNSTLVLGLLRDLAPGVPGSIPAR